LTRFCKGKKIKKNNEMKTSFVVAVAVFTLAAGLHSAEYHVAMNGSDTNPGTKTSPFRTIQRAANAAQPGDAITVHEGVYRERIDPPRGGASDASRITYQAAPGEMVVITGSEPVKNWVKVTNDTWEVTIPNSFFGKFNPYADRIHGDWCSNPRGYHTGAVYLDGDWLTEAAHLDDALKPADQAPLWFAVAGGVVEDGPESSQVAPTKIPPENIAAKNDTMIYAQFAGVNPNDAKVQINVRQTVFTPSKTGINYLTVRGFELRDAAAPWAPPTAAQIGIISAYWCKGWIIESNHICYSPCCGVALGKYGDEWDNRAQSAEGYVGTLTRALTNGWNQATVGSHLVRDNEISHCEQTGVVGSLGCSFSTVTGNEIHDIHIRNLYGGAEMAGIKFHGAIDVIISHNHIYRCGTWAGIWLDWMAQGCQVVGNLLNDNSSQDIFFEMQHGPILVVNNLLLSRSRAFAMNSQGIAFAHNLIAGPIASGHGDKRITPFELAHTTALGGMYPAANGDSGDDRFYNNLFAGTCNLQVMDNSALPCFAAGNVFTRQTQPSKFDAGVLVATNFDTGVKLEQKSDGWYLSLAEDPAWRGGAKRQLVTAKLLGTAKVSGCAYENADGAPQCLNTDYFGIKRKGKNPFPGPFEKVANGKQEIKVWPVTMMSAR
jgi:alpha-N-arabinofuranosidase